MASTTKTQLLESTEWFNEHFKIGLKQTLKFSLSNPRMAFFMAGKLAQYNVASRRRHYWREQGVQVPSPQKLYHS